VLADTTFTKYSFFSRSQGNAAYYVDRARLLTVARSGGGSSGGDAVSKSRSYKTNYEKDERNEYQQ
jgi:hypothetical protein